MGCLVTGAGLNKLEAPSWTPTRQRHRAIMVVSSWDEWQLFPADPCATEQPYSGPHCSPQKGRDLEKVAQKLPTRTTPGQVTAPVGIFHTAVEIKNKQ